MTILVATVKGTAATIRGQFIARTYTPENIETVVGVRALTPEQLRFVQAVTDALQTFLSNGPGSYGHSWEIQITKNVSDWRGSPETTPKQRKKK
jgi:hypothetical protein